MHSNNLIDNTKTIDQHRSNWKYRLLESFTGLTAIGFIIVMISLAIFNPSLLAMFLIVYSFFIVLKSGLHTIYTFYTFSNIYRWENIQWLDLLEIISVENKPENKTTTPTLVTQKMHQIGNLYPTKMNWTNEWSEFITIYNNNQNTKFADPNSLFQIIFVPIYNESVEVMTQSLQRIFESGYDLSKIWVVIAQEGRAGNKFNNSLKAKIQALDWVNVDEIDEQNLSLVYGDHSLNSSFDNLEVSFDSTKLQVILAKHPDGMVGEIKGKGSNLDWAGRQVSLLANKYLLDDETTVITVLDCDSRPGKNFFQILAFRFCMTPDRENVGFQPIPVFTNNYFDSTILSSLVATGTTLWNFVQSSIPEEIHHFANYSVSLSLLRKTNFWVKDLVSEDSLFFDKNFCELEGKYRSLPTFAYFESDVVESPTFGEALLNQYKQLRRWAYGGVEGMSYLGRRLLLEDSGKKIDGRKKFMILFNEWIGHFLWSTMPFVFGFIIFLPSIFNREFGSSVLANNLSFFSQYFSIITYTIVFLNGFVITHYIQTRFYHKNQKLTWHNYLDLLLQTALSPIFFSIWFLPPIEAQIRGILGQYLGFWVTPKGGE